MTNTHITLLVEDFRKLVSASGQAFRLPSLERVFARGQSCQFESPSANHLRFALFGIDTVPEVPVAALTHVSDRKKALRNDYYWLRADPVTMWADMAQVFMTSHGFADLDPYERNEIENCIRSVLMEEGVDFHADHPERWCIALNEPLHFEFTPLADTLGVDVADALPSHPEAGFWRRILNEIQVALHNCPVNVRRRQSGRQEVNSVWFWGGGFIPDTAPHDLIDTVYSNHPVTRGLAIINDCRLKHLEETSVSDFDSDGQAVLIDWLPATRFAEEELEKLEILVRQLLDRVEESSTSMTIVDGSGHGRIFTQNARFRVWRRKAPLYSMMSIAAGK